MVYLIRGQHSSLVMNPAFPEIAGLAAPVSAIRG